MPEADNDPQTGNQPVVSDRTRVLDDLALLETAALEAGRLALGFFKQEPKNWLKDGKSPVSEADLAVDQLLTDILRAARPDYGWLSEETADTPDRLSARHAFIIDPIDGTRAFLAGKDEWTVSLAVVENGLPTAGVVFCPVREEIYVAASGQGARLNGTALAVSPKTDLVGARLSGPQSIVGSQSAVDAGFERAENLRSLAYRLTMVAAGRVEVAAARANANDWDLAAADLLVQEAGGRLTDFTGASRRYNGVTTRHPALLAAPLSLVGPACSILSETVA